MTQLPQLPIYSEKLLEKPQPVNPEMQFSYMASLRIYKAKRKLENSLGEDPAPTDLTYEGFMSEIAAQKAKEEMPKAPKIVTTVPLGMIDLQDIDPAWGDRIDSIKAEVVKNTNYLAPTYQAPPLVIDNGEPVGDDQFGAVMSARDIINRIHSGIDFPVPGSQN